MRLPTRLGDEVVDQGVLVEDLVQRDLVRRLDLELDRKLHDDVRDPDALDILLLEAISAIFLIRRD